MTVLAIAAMAAGKSLERWDAEPGELDSGEVEIAVDVCALCHSDLHVIDDDWRISRYPLVPGHEVVGRVAAIGQEVTGLAVFSALERPVTRRGMRVIGIGGLGHLGVQFAAKMGSSVVAFDIDAGRLDRARTLGSDEAYLIDGHRRAGELDVLISTTSANLDWNVWLDHLTIGGTMCLLGYPMEALTVSADRLLDGQKNLTGSVIGSPSTMRTMLAFSTNCMTNSFSVIQKTEGSSI